MREVMRELGEAVHDQEVVGIEGGSFRSEFAPPEKKAAGAAGNRFVRNVRFAAKHEVMGTARLGAEPPGRLKWPKAEGQLSVYYAAKRTLTVICLSAVDNTQAPSLRDHLDESRNTMPAGPLR